MTTIRGNRAVGNAIRQGLDAGAPGRLSAAELRTIKSTALDQMEHATRPSTTLRAIERAFDDTNVATQDRYAQRFASFLQELGGLVETPVTPRGTALKLSEVRVDPPYSRFQAKLTAEGDLSLRGALLGGSSLRFKLGNKDVAVTPETGAGVRVMVELLRKQLPDKDVLVKTHASGTYTLQVWPKGKAPSPPNAPVYSHLQAPAGLVEGDSGPLRFRIFNSAVNAGEVIRLRVDNTVYTVRGGANVKTGNDVLYALRAQLRADGLDAEVQRFGGLTTFIIKPGR